MTAEEALRRPSLAWKQSHITALFGATLFVSATAMFMLQPMAGKMLLPLVGGTPAGWITAMAFFQVMLLAGYALASFLSRFSPRGHGLAFIALLVAGVLFLPVNLPQETGGEMGAPLVLRLLAVSTGVPFVALSMASSTLQRLFAASAHREARDPYFLFAASNLGSFAGLLLYPVAAETLLTTPQQAQLWFCAYALLILMSCACLKVSGAPAQIPSADAAAAPMRKKLHWALLAFFPSSLMMGVTTHITTEIISAPLLWVLPLGIYLLTFVMAFARRQVVSLSLLDILHPSAVAGAIFAILLMTMSIGTTWAMIFLHLGAFAAVALAFHARLASLRPLDDGRGLAGYYLMIAAGGALGGVLNAFIAPLVFDRLAEYPLVLLLSCLCNPVLMKPLLERRTRPVALPVAAALVAAFLFAWSGTTGDEYYSRNFYGVINVYDGAAEVGGVKYDVRQFRHGSTLHGMQVRNGGMETAPVSYFGRGSPIGDVFAVYKPRKIAVLGLGAGTLSCYAAPQSSFTFIEIDPAVIAMAKTQFTFLDKCRGAEPHRIIAGDGRIEMAKLKGEKFDLIVLDAFSSDMVPVHLVSQEAIALYKAHLEKGGILAFNISNRYLGFSHILAAAAEAAGMKARFRDDHHTQLPLFFPNEWLVMAAPGVSLEPLRARAWATPDPAGMRPWSDSYSNIAGVLRF